jgi:uncharacterized protein YkwD
MALSWLTSTSPLHAPTVTVCVQATLLLHACLVIFHSTTLICKLTAHPPCHHPGNPSPVTRRPPPPPTVSSADWRVDMLNRVNQERARIGVAALCFNWKLRVAAERHNNDMIAGNFLGHVGRDRSDVGSRVRAAGYQSFQAVGENVLWRMDTSVANAHTQWMNSQLHREAILSRNYRHIGLARGQARDGKWYWTQVFGSSFSSSEGCTGI